MYTEYNNIEIYYPDEMSLEEAIGYVDEELDLNPKMKLTSITMKLSANKQDVEFYPVYDTINRIRRITGYLSTLAKFNDAKRAEERNRIAHFDY